METSLGKISSKISILFSAAMWFFVAASAVTYVVAAYMGDSNPRLRITWQFSAISGLIAFACETYVASVDKTNATTDQKQLQDKINDLREKLAWANGKLDALEPRSLNPFHRKIIKEAISQFAGQKVSILCRIDDPDALGYAHDFMSLFTDAGWSCNHNIINQAVGAGFHNLQVAVSDKLTIDAQPMSANILNLVLDQLQLSNSRDRFRVSEGIEGDDIVLMIGPKPPSSLPHRELFTGAKDLGE